MWIYSFIFFSISYCKVFINYLIYKIHTHLNKKHNSCKHVLHWNSPKSLSFQFPLQMIIINKKQILTWYLRANCPKYFIPLIHLILITLLQGVHYYTLHFIGEETEAQGGSLHLVTQLVSSKAGVWTRAAWLQSVYSWPLVLVLLSTSEGIILWLLPAPRVTYHILILNEDSYIPST